MFGLILNKFFEKLLKKSRLDRFIKLVSSFALINKRDKYRTGNSKGRRTLVIFRENIEEKIATPTKMRALNILTSSTICVLNTTPS